MLNFNTLDALNWTVLSLILIEDIININVINDIIDEEF